MNVDLGLGEPALSWLGKCGMLKLTSQALTSSNEANKSLPVGILIVNEAKYTRQNILHLLQLKLKRVLRL